MLNRLRELTKSFGNQVESQRTEQLKRTKAEVEKNVTRILKLIKNEDNQGKGKRKASKRETELLGLVENLYKEFESLYALCDHLIIDSKKTPLGKTESEYSNFSSDSEYYSSEEIDINNAKLEAEVSELRQKLSSVSEENKGLKMEVDKKRGEILALEKANEDNGKQSSARIKELEGQLSGLEIEKEKRKGFASRVLELESAVKEKESENLILMKKVEENERNFALKIEELEAQNSDMREEIDSLCVNKGELEEVLVRERENGLARVEELVDQKSGLEAKLDRKSAEVLDHLVKIECLNEELAKKILAEEELTARSLVNDREEDLDYLVSNRGELELISERNSHEKAKTLMIKEMNLQVVERKVEDMAEKLRISFEDNLRLLHQRILVTEQLHNENKESYNAAKDGYERDKKELEDKISSYERELKKIKEVSESAQCTMNGLDLVVRKFEEENGYFVNRISKVLNELKFTKRWVKGTTGEIKRLKHNVDCLVAFLDHKEEQEFLLRDKVWKLEAKASKEGGEKLNLMQEMSQLEKKLGKYERLVKEKDERLLNLGDEKREAIRQLCISVDYHRCRVDQLKQIILKMRMGW